MMSIIRWIKDTYKGLRGIQEGGVVTKSGVSSDGSSQVYAGKISTGNLSIGGNNIHTNTITNIELPEVLDNMVYYNGTYLVLSQESKIEFYKIDDDKDNECKVQLSENIITKFNGKEVDKDDIPKDILDEVVKGEI